LIRYWGQPKRRWIKRPSAVKTERRKGNTQRQSMPWRCDLLLTSGLYNIESTNERI
jgi:hypothetical protein